MEGGYGVSATNGDIPNNTIEISQQEYQEYQYLRTKGKILKLKKEFNPKEGLFGYIEEYIDKSQDSIEESNTQDNSAEIESLKQQILELQRMIIDGTLTTL